MPLILAFSSLRYSGKVGSGPGGPEAVGPCNDPFRLGACPASRLLPIMVSLVRDEASLDIAFVLRSAPSDCVGIDDFWLVAGLRYTLF